MEDNQKDLKKGRDRSEDEQTKLSILAKTDQVKGEQLMFTPEGNIESRNELQALAGLAAAGPIDDPQKKFDIYYKGITKLLRDHLPKGKANKQARDFIFEEKNTFLTRGKRKDDTGRRGADGRMGYIEDAEAIMQVITDWIFRNGTMVELYNTLRDMNIQKGYGAPKP